MQLKLRNEPRIIETLPVQELWADQRLISTIRLRVLTATEIGHFLQTETIRFVVAEIGKALSWIPNNERFEFWQDQIKPYLLQGEPKYEPKAFHDTYFYRASEWKSYNGQTIILLEKYD